MRMNLKYATKSINILKLIRKFPELFCLFEIQQVCLYEKENEQEKAASPFAYSIIHTKLKSAKNAMGPINIITLFLLPVILWPRF